MTYDEAEEQALKVRWKISTCGVGEECWCRIIIPEETIHINHSDGITEYDSVYSVVDSGAVSKEVAERIVRDHNMIVMWDEMLDSYDWFEDGYEVFWKRLKDKENEQKNISKL
jgi:hypothetical protein